MADRRVPVFSARAGDFETQPPSSCQLGSTFAPQRLPRMAFPPADSSLQFAAREQLSTEPGSEAVSFHPQRVANGRTQWQGPHCQEVVDQGCVGATCGLLYPPLSFIKACRIRKSDKELGNLSISASKSGMPVLSRGIPLSYTPQGSGIPVQHSVPAQGWEDGAMAQLSRQAFCITGSESRPLHALLLHASM